MKRAVLLVFAISIANAQEAENGKAGPATSAGRSGIVHWPVVPGLEVIGQYTFRGSQDAAGKTQWFHVFDLPRAHGSIGGSYGPALARLLLEAVPSASDGALVGVSGDSLVLRVREAYAGFSLQKDEESWGAAMQAGVIPTITIPELEGTWMMRAVAPSTLETTGIMAPADMGAGGRFVFPRRFGWIGAAFTNGEGYTSRDLNRGKNLETGFDVHPFALSERFRPLGIFFSWVLGSQGAAATRTDRWTWGILWQGVRVRAGTSLTYAIGLKNDGEQPSVVLDAFARVEPIEKLLFGARFSYWNVDTRAPAPDSVITMTAAAGYRIWKPLEVYVAADGSIPSNLAKTTMPQTDFWDLRVIGRAVFLITGGMMFHRIAALLCLVGCSEAARPPKDGSVSDTSTPDTGMAMMDGSMTNDGGSTLCGHALLDPKKSALVVNEMQAKGMEFFEIYNTSSNAVDLSGLSAADTDDDGGCPKTSAALLFPNGTSVPGGGYIVVYTGQLDAGSCGDAGCFNATYKISNGSGETIFVLDGTGAVTTSGTYPANAAPSGKSWARLPNGTGDFTVGTPTPGAANMP